MFTKGRICFIENWIGRYLLEPSILKLSTVILVFMVWQKKPKMLPDMRGMVWLVITAVPLM